MEEHPTHSIAGGWLGTYAYGSALRKRNPVRFEATFREAGEGWFTGAILDDSTHGEARVEGSIRGSIVRFIKTYLAPPPPGEVAATVEYVGALSDDGKTMSGTWRLAATSGEKASGVWDARRQWTAEAEPEMIRAEAVAELSGAERGG